MGYAFGWWVLQNKNEDVCEEGPTFFQALTFSKSDGGQRRVAICKSQAGSAIPRQKLFFKNNLWGKKKKRGENKNFNNKSAKEGERKGGKSLGYGRKGQRSVAYQLASKNRRTAIRSRHVIGPVLDRTRKRQDNNTVFCFFFAFPIYIYILICLHIFTKQ